MQKNHCIVIIYILTISSSFSQTGWTQDQRLSFIYGQSFFPRAACCGDTVHLVWYSYYLDSIDIYEEVFYKRSTNGGADWLDHIMLSEVDGNGSFMPIIACEESLVYVFWLESDYGTVFRKSTDSGLTWGAIDSTLQNEGYYDIYVENDTVYLSGGHSPGNVIFRMSNDGCLTWQPLQIAGFGTYVRQAVYPPVVALAYEVNRYGQEIMFKRSTDKGLTWVDSMVVSYDDSISSWSPRISLDSNGGIYVIWADYKYSPYPWTGDIFCRISRDFGQNWEVIDSLTVTHRAAISSITSESTRVHIVWEDDRNDPNQNFEIYYRMSSNLGQNWEPEIRLTDAPGHSEMPEITCGSNFLHVFWVDYRDDSNNVFGEIYYKRKELVGSINESTNKLAIANCQMYILPSIFKRRLDVIIRNTGYDLDIKIFNILGQEVNNYDIKYREHQISIEAGNLPSGIYFLDLQQGAKHVIIKTVKVR